MLTTPLTPAVRTLIQGSAGPNGLNRMAQPICRTHGPPPVMGPEPARFIGRSGGTRRQTTRPAQGEAARPCDSSPCEVRPP